ncbi:MAG: manganese catalase family protein [Pyrinomonadaceae bacterium]|nr:manganese catalase family protein [Pyrinomonadaceae bacterium]
MFLRIDRLPVELPMPTEADHNAASNVQELLGGRFGEMSTLMNYMFQSFNFKGRTKLKPFYDVISNIATEELGHIEIVSAAINLLLNGPVSDETAKNQNDEPDGIPFDFMKDMRNSHHFVASGFGALPANSMGEQWNGSYVFSSGNLILDLLHNFFLENGARTQKLRVYEMTKNPAAREMLGYLFVRGGVHALAYAKALESVTGVKMSDMLPIPNIPNTFFAEARKFEARGMHRILYRFSQTDYTDMGAIWNGMSPDGTGELEIVDAPPEGGKMQDLEGIASAFSPDYRPEEIFEMANKLYKKAQNK